MLKNVFVIINVPSTPPLPPPRLYGNNYSHVGSQIIK